jgi:hypothetical protein
MDQRFSPFFIGGAVLAIAVLMAVAIVAEQWRRRQDRSDGVLASWDDLRLTPSQLIVGSRRDAERIPLDGLSATVDFTEGEGGDFVLLIIDNAGREIRRSQPYSYGSSGNAQMFAVMFNSLSGHSKPAAGMPATVTHVAFGRRADRRAA